MRDRILISVIGIVKSSVIGGLVAAITSIVIAGGDLEAYVIALLMILYLLPAMLLYHLGCVLKLKQYICDILYFVGFLSLELYFGIGIVNALKIVHRQRYSDGSEGWGIFFLYIITFTGIAVYLAEVIFRGLKSIKELGHKEVFEEFRWATVSGRIFSQLQPIFIGVIRSCIIASIVVLVAATGPGFTNKRLEPIFITKGLVYLTGLLPAIVLYHIALALKLKRRKCDNLYFIAFVAVEIFSLPALNLPPEITHDLWYGMAVIALACVAVYMSEVYFRNWVILKNLQVNTENEAGKPYSYYPIRKLLFGLGIFLIIFSILAIVVCSVTSLAKHREQERENQIRTFVSRIIESARNQTEYYKNNAKEKVIAKLNYNIEKMSGNFDVTIGSYPSGPGSYSNCRIVFENGNVFIADIEYENGDLFLRRFWSEPELRLYEEVFSEFLERKASMDTNNK
jgi:hypothetical protein